MKKLFFIILIMAGCASAYAQADSVRVWNKWCTRRDTMLLFATANNLIQIYSPTLKAAEINVKSLDAKTLRIGEPEVKGDTISVMAMPYPAKGKKMRLAITNKKSGKIIKTINFDSDNIPPLVARVGNIQTAEASRKEILAQLSMKATFPKSLYSYPYKIKGYTFKIHSDKGAATIKINGFFITKEVLEQIKDAPGGTIAEFTDIQATCPECSPRKLDDIKLKIK